MNAHDRIGTARHLPSRMRILAIGTGVLLVLLGEMLAVADAGDPTDREIAEAITRGCGVPP